jgi:anaerobic selenocysteine-containing dehydrogenase
LVRGADPWYGLPDAVGFKDATFNVPLIVSFSGIVDDTTAMADLILPEHSFLEDWGADVPDPGPGYQVVGFQQPAVRPLFEARGMHLGTRGFADVLMTVAQGLEIDLGLPGETFKDVLQDGARQLFEMDRGSVRAPDFKSFWNGLLQRGGWWDVSAKSADKPPPAPRLPKPEEPEFFPQDSAQYPFHLVPFVSTSLGDGRGASLPWLQATPDPITTATWQTWVEINIRTAEAKDIKEGDVIAVSSAYGRIEALAFPHPGMPPDVVSIPMGQGHQAGGRYAEGRGSNPLSILAPSMDGKTGALAWAATRVKIEKTDRWIRLPKFENAVPDLPTDEHQEIIQIATRDS